jgi:hypothetical protein
MSDRLIPKQYLKKKTFSIYKCHIVDTVGEELNIFADFDIYGLTKEAAFTRELDPIDIDKIESLKGRVVVFTEFIFNTKDLDDKPTMSSLVDGVYYVNLTKSGEDCIAVTLTGKKYKTNLIYDRIVELEVDIDRDNEVKTLRKVVFEEVNSALAQ